jgi:acetyl-CoA carboxylase/biotin carboxylase 1
MHAQEAKPGDRGALAAQLEPLLAVAEAHAEGKEAFARSIATELFSDYLSVEERFAANKEATEQEVIDSLRQVPAPLLPGPLDHVLIVSLVLLAPGGAAPAASLLCVCLGLW